MTNWQFVYQIVHDRIAFGVKNWRFDLPDSNPGFTGSWYPAVCPYFPTPRSGEGGYRITKTWWNYLVGMQPNEEKLRQVGGGWINHNHNKNWKAGTVLPVNHRSPMPYIEGVTSVGNWVVGDSIKNKSLHLVYIPLGSSPSGDYFHNPLQWSKFSSISKKGLLGLVGDNIYTPVMAKFDVYIPLSRLEQIPQLPRVEKTTRKITVYEYPTTRADKLKKIKRDKDVTIVDYHLWGSDVWGKLQSGGWIQLRYVNRALVMYYTTWSMQTDAPLAEYPKRIQPLSDFLEGWDDSQNETEYTIPQVTKLQMMWAMILAAKAVGDDVRGWLSITNMTNLVNPASSASEMYDGGAVEDFPLSEEAVNAILAALKTIKTVEMDPIYELTNQLVINAFYQAASTLGMSGWDLLLKADMTSLVNKRLAYYIGPAADDMPGLTSAEKQALAAAVDPESAPVEPVDEGNEGGTEEPGAVPYDGLTNQQMIIAFYRMAETFDTDGWSMINLANMASLADDRTAFYSGPPAEEITGLSDAQQLVLLEEVLTLWGQTQAETYSGIKNQDVINLFYAAAGIMNENGWDWIQQAKMEYLAIPSIMRTLPYRGPKFEELTGLSGEKLQALAQALQQVLALA